jgi:hypothetical protein
VTAANVSHLPAPEPKPERKPKKKASPVVAAQEAEADDGFVTVELRGVALRIPVRGKVPIAAVDAFRAGDNYEGTKQMIGEEQWKRLSDAGFTMDDIDELGDKLNEATGNS